MLKTTEKIYLADHGLREALYGNNPRGFLRYIYLRPSCYSCPTKSLKSGSDIMLADYWGVQSILSEFDDDKGVSLVLINTSKGEKLYDQIYKESIETSYDEAVRGNQSVEKSVVMLIQRSIFFKNGMMAILSR